MDFFDLNKKTYAILWISYNCQMLWYVRIAQKPLALKPYAYF